MLAEQPGLAGLADKVQSWQTQAKTAQAEFDVLEKRLQALDAESAKVKDQIKNNESEIARLEEIYEQAVTADAPRDMEELAGRALGGGAGLFALAWGLRSVEGADEEPWYKVPMVLAQRAGHRAAMDFRSLGGTIAQHLLVADIARSFWLDTNRTALGKVVDEKGYYTPADVWNAYEGKYTSQTLSRAAWEGFLSISQTAGTTLALADLVQDIPQTGFSPARIFEGLLETIGTYVAAVTLPGAQLKNLAGQFMPEEAKARIARPYTDNWTAYIAGPLLQPLGNVPGLNRAIPETTSQLTGKPIETFWPGVRALIGVTLSEQTEVQHALTEAGVPPQSMFIRSSGNDDVDRQVAMAYAQILTTKLPPLLNSEEFKKLTSPALRRDRLQQFLSRSKVDAWATAAEDMQPAVYQDARETPEAKRRRERWERFNQMDEAREFEREELERRRQQGPQAPPPGFEELGGDPFAPPEPDAVEPPSVEPPSLGAAGFPGAAVPEYGVEPPRMPS